MVKSSSAKIEREASKEIFISKNHAQHCVNIYKLAERKDMENKKR